MARRPLALSLVAIGLLLPATARAQSAPLLPDVPVAACPAGAASADLTVANAARRTWQLGPFAVTLDGDALTVAADHHGLWSSASDGFVAAGAGDSNIFDGGGGFYRIQSRFTDCWRRQSVTAATLTSRTRLTLRGRLTGSLGGTSAAGPLTYTATLQPAGARRLRLSVRLHGVATANAIMLSSSSVAGESVHGFGAQTRWNLKGHQVAVLTREQGVGRGDPVITQ